MKLCNYLLCKKPRHEDRENQTVTRRTIQGQRLASALVLLSAEFKTYLSVFFGVYIANRGLNIVRGSNLIDGIFGRPANKIFAAFAGQLRKLGAPIGGDPASPLPVLDRLIGHTHLSRHIGKRVKMRNCAVQCWVHISRAVGVFESSIAQETLVAQVKIQLQQGFLVGIFSL